MFEILITALFIFITNYFTFTSIQAVIIILIYLSLVLPGIITYLQGPPYIPSSPKTIQTAIQLSNLKPTDIVVDLGCGDGRFLIAASPFCKQAIGYETSLLTFLVAKLKTQKHPNIQVRYQNFWNQNYQDVDVIFCFLLQNLMPKFHQKIFQKLPAGTKIISNTFKLPNIQPQKQIQNLILYQK